MNAASAMPGASTLQAEVTHISPHGIWLLLGEREMFMSFEDFPWFRQAAVAAIHDLEWPSPGHLYWPQLDIDLAVESIEHPEHFPLVSKSN